MDQNNVKNRLQEYLKHKGITQLSFCQSLGVSTGYISSIRKSISADKISSITAIYPDLNITWLLTGTGDMIVDRTTAQHELPVVSDDSFWKDLVTQLRDDIKYWKDRCTSAEDQLRKIDDLNKA